MSKSNKQSQQSKKKIDKRRVFVSIIAGVMILCMILPMLTMILEYM